MADLSLGSLQIGDLQGGRPITPLPQRASAAFVAAFCGSRIRAAACSLSRLGLLPPQARQPSVPPPDGQRHGRWHPASSDAGATTTEFTPLVRLATAVQVRVACPYTDADVSNARLILVILLCASPAILAFDGAIVHGVLAGVAAVGIAIVSRTMRPVETQFFLSFAKRAAVVAAIPALWMLIQVLPLPFLAHPIWTSAQTGIGHPIAGSISIDIGAGVMALGFYLTIVAVAFWSASVAVDRQRAEWLLFALMIATALIGLTVAAATVFKLPHFDTTAVLFDRTQAIDCVAMGVMIAAAAGVRTLERYETRRTSPTRSVSALLWTYVACVAALAICIAALIMSAPVSTLVATSYGAFALLSVALIRRLGLGSWAALAIAVFAIAVAGLVAAREPGLPNKNLTLAFADSPASLTELSQRILDDTPLIGTGAGTIAAIAPIYRDVDDRTPLSTAPTAAAATAIELVRPMLWLIVATTVFSIFILLRASLQRGRDSFYPMAGASCLITLLILSFMNPGVLGSAAAIIAAATLGLAIAQSKSRSVQQ